MSENSGALCSKDIDPTGEIGEQGPRDRTSMWQGGSSRGEDCSDSGETKQLRLLKYLSPKMVH